MAWTQAQATAWIAQELPKAKTPEDAVKRIGSEERMLAFIDTQPKPDAASRYAHAELIVQLKSKFALA